MTALPKNQWEFFKKRVKSTKKFLGILKCYSKVLEVTDFSFDPSILKKWLFYIAKTLPNTTKNGKKCDLWLSKKPLPNLEKRGKKYQKFMGMTYGSCPKVTFFAGRNFERHFFSENVQNTNLNFFTTRPFLSKTFFFLKESS